MYDVQWGMYDHAMPVDRCRRGSQQQQLLLSFDSASTPSPEENTLQPGYMAILKDGPSLSSSSASAAAATTPSGYLYTLSLDCPFPWPASPSYAVDGGVAGAGRSSRSIRDASGRVDDGASGSRDDAAREPSAAQGETYDGLGRDGSHPPGVARVAVPPQGSAIPSMLTTTTTTRRTRETIDDAEPSSTGYSGSTLAPPNNRSPLFHLHLLLPHLPDTLLELYWECLYRLESVRMSWSLSLCSAFSLARSLARWLLRDSRRPPTRGETS